MEGEEDKARLVNLCIRRYTHQNLRGACLQYLFKVLESINKTVGKSRNRASG